MRVLVCGSRNWIDYGKIHKVIDDLNRNKGIGVIIEGGARGADEIAKRVAKALSVPVLEFKANWKKYGRSAGPIRNRQMIQEGKPDLVIAFHNNLSKSKGTKNMIKQVRKFGIKFEVFESDSAKGGE